MNLFARISATLGATAETAVSRFENHDAIAESALLEARQAVAKARVRHQRLVKSVDEIRASLGRSEEQAQRWTMRAQNLASTDEQKALQCLEQRKLCQEQAANHSQNLAKHEDLAAGMASRLKHMEERLQGMVSQRDEMRSRESLAKATQVMDRIDHQGRDGVDAVFERWELNISDTEIRNGAHQDDSCAMPSLQRELDEQERQEELQDELAELIAKSEADKK